MVLYRSHKYLSRYRCYKGYDEIHLSIRGPCNHAASEGCEATYAKRLCKFEVWGYMNRQQVEAFRHGYRRSKIERKVGRYLHW